MSTDDWRHRAVCREEDPELFFPVGNTGPALAQAEEAKVVCRRCPVMEQCLQWALESGQDAGVWGGLSEGERRKLKRRIARRNTEPRPPANCGTRSGYRRHHREHTAICDPCRGANNDYVNQHGQRVKEIA